jgi:hypothetical protein
MQSVVHHRTVLDMVSNVSLTLENQEIVRVKRDVNIR